MKKRILSIMLALFMITALMPVLPGFAVSASADGLDLQGDGTEESPYLISDSDEFIKFRNWVNDGHDCQNQYFMLTDSIDLDGSGATVNHVETKYIPDNQHIPIGNQNNQFKGHFDGAGHAVLNMCIQKIISTLKTAPRAHIKACSDI